MIIDDNLNLVVPLYRESGAAYAYVHSRPVSVSTFDVHFRVILRAFNMMVEEGPVGARSASRFLRAAAADLNLGSGGYLPLLNEIERLSTVMIGSETGWQPVPLQQAAGMLEGEDGAEAVNASVFFTVAWHAVPKRTRLVFIENFSKLWGAETSSSPLTEWIASLPTSTKAVVSPLRDAAAKAQEAHANAAMNVITVAA
jgi:hypothetical protein